MCCHANCGKGTPSQPQGHWEDNGFLALNRRILHAAGGNWKRPPAREALREQFGGFYQEMGDLVYDRATGNAKWGWKEPRTTLLAHLWHTVLLDGGYDPRYVICARPQTEIVQSLIRRNGGAPGRWRDLCAAYMLAIFRFISDHQPEHVIVSFNALTSGDTQGEALTLARFAGVEDRVDAMVDRVQRREAS